jgi:uncharacterized protein (DUF362 family)
MFFNGAFGRKQLLARAAGFLGTIEGANLIAPWRALFGVPVKAGGSTIYVIRGKDLSKSSIDAMAAAGFREMGGISAFVRKGMKVVIKPNIGWNSPPEKAHNTNPDLVEAVARMCVQAGASVSVFDRSVNSAQLTYPRSGIEAAAKRAGAKVSHIDDRKFRDVAVPRALLFKTLPVYEEILKADLLINMPIAKHHSLSTLTLAMKNLMGVLGGSRGIYHGDMHKSIVDFNKAIKSHLVILDATRILTDHGPNGGTARDVRELRTVVFGTNPVTVDAYAATFFNINPRSLGFLALAAREGMGVIDVGSMNLVQKNA